MTQPRDHLFFNDVGHRYRAQHPKQGQTKKQDKTNANIHFFG
jgi:hypothetical protein